MLKIAVLVSGGGTNLQALLDSEARGENPHGKITLVVASKPGVYALERAAKAGVESCVVSRKDYASPDTKAIGDALIHREMANIPKEKVRQIVLQKCPRFVRAFALFYRVKIQRVENLAQFAFNAPAACILFAPLVEGYGDKMPAVVIHAAKLALALFRAFGFVKKRRLKIVVKRGCAVIRL